MYFLQLFSLRPCQEQIWLGKRAGCAALVVFCCCFWLLVIGESWEKRVLVLTVGPAAHRIAASWIELLYRLYHDGVALMSGGELLFERTVLCMTLTHKTLFAPHHPRRFPTQYETIHIPVRLNLGSHWAPFLSSKSCTLVDPNRLIISSCFSPHLDCFLQAGGKSRRKPDLLRGCKIPRSEPTYIGLLTWPNEEDYFDFLTAESTETWSAIDDTEGADDRDLFTYLS